MNQKNKKKFENLGPKVRVVPFVEEFQEKENTDEDPFEVCSSIVKKTERIELFYFLGFILYLLLVQLQHLFKNGGNLQ